MDPYDIRRYKPRDSDVLAAYLARDDVRAALHVPASVPCWGCQASQVEQALIADLNAPTSLPLWPALLTQIPVRCRCCKAQLFLVALPERCALDPGLGAQACTAARHPIAAAPSYVLPCRTQILVYSGQFDLICNSLGTSRYLQQLLWPGVGLYRAANRSVWMVDGKVAGFWQEGGGLVHVVVTGAGHMAPADQPAACYDMVQTFLESATRMGK